MTEIDQDFDDRKVVIHDAGDFAGMRTAGRLAAEVLDMLVPEVVPGYPDRLLPVSEAAAKELKKRTLTNLYNANPTWLQNLHATLDRAVWDAYGWPEDETPAEVEEDVILGRLLALNLERAGGE